MSLGSGIDRCSCSWEQERAPRSQRLPKLGPRGNALSGEKAGGEGARPRPRGRATLPVGGPGRRKAPGARLAPRSRGGRARTGKLGGPGEWGPRSRRSAARSLSRGVTESDHGRPRGSGAGASGLRSRLEPLPLSEPIVAGTAPGLGSPPGRAAAPPELEVALWLRLGSAGLQLLVGGGCATRSQGVVGAGRRGGVAGEGLGSQNARWPFPKPTPASCPQVTGVLLSRKEDLT